VWRAIIATDGSDEDAHNRQSAQWASAFLMRLQLRKGETGHLPEPDLVLGAVPFSPTNPVLRIDVTHHVVQALLKTAEYRDLEGIFGPQAGGCDRSVSQLPAGR
jgi:hypothetical protein